MNTFRCAACRRQLTAAPYCPHCGAEQEQWTEELARIERAIAEMKARDAQLLQEQKTLASKLQAAIFQRDYLANAGKQQRKGKPHRTFRRESAQAPPTVKPGPRIPRQPRAGRPKGAPPPPGPPPSGRPRTAEASSRQVQNVLLGLGALLLGVAAAVYAAVADDVTRLAILTASAVLMLGVPPVVARRGLTATAETLSAVGLLLVTLDCYALWMLDPVRSGPLSGPVFAGLTLTVTAAVAAGYGGATGLAVPGYAFVLALQPILPLLGHTMLTSPVGWAFALFMVAALNLYLADRLGRPGGLALPGWRPNAGWLTPPAPMPRARPGHERPETAVEETDTVVSGTETTATRHRTVDPASNGTGATTAGDSAEPVTVDDRVKGEPLSAGWLRELTWLLHGLAVAAALATATAAVVDSDTVPTAVRAGAVLVLAAALGLIGARMVRRHPLPDLAASVLTLAVMGAASRVVAVALPGRALLLVAVVITLTALGVRAVPTAVRRGPQLASAVALVVIGVVVAGAAARAALAPIRAALPAWHADLTAYPEQFAAAVGPTDWQLAVTALLLTIAAALSLPIEFRREFAVAGAALTALAVPASLGLAWWAVPWPPVLAAIAIAGAGLTARTERAVQTHAAAAAVVGIAGAAASVARPGLTAAILATLTVAGAALAHTAMARNATDPIAGRLADWAAGGAAAALPGALAAFCAAVLLPLQSDPTPAALQATTARILAAGSLGACIGLGFASISQVARRQIGLPLALGTGIGALVVTVAAFAAPGTTLTDAWVGALVIVAALLLVLSPVIDSNRRSDRLLDGADYATAAATVALVGALVRIAAIVLPGMQLVAAAGLVLLVAAGVRALPSDWRRGPIAGIAASGGLLALIAGATALRGGAVVLTTPGRLWHGDLDAWPITTADPGAWQVPVTLVLLAAVAALVLPRPWAYDVAGALVGLATIGTPAALGLPWWSPIVVGCGVAACYALASVPAADPRAGLTRAAVAGAIALHALAASLVRPWTTAAALGVVAAVAFVVAGLARVVATLSDERTVSELDSDEDRDTGGQGTDNADPMPPHLALIGGSAAMTGLLALPGSVAALAATLGHPAEVVLTAALAASSLGVALLALARRQMPHYLPYGTVGIAVGATAVAVASLPTGLPTGVYAAAAVLLGVLAELLRGATVVPGGLSPVWRWSGRFGRTTDGSATHWHGGWSVSPVVGAIAAAALPTALAMAALAVVLNTALAAPYQTLRGIWEGPPAALTAPPTGSINATNVTAALLLTLAAALAATGFNGRRPTHAVPVVLPGAAITLLIAPISLGLAWPASTLAALGVFAISMLGLAVTPPPQRIMRARPIRVARVVVFIIGLAGGGAGLAGSLATPQLTLLTLGGAVVVGAIAGFAGRTQHARILGWLFAAAMAQGFVLTTGKRLGIEPEWSSFGVLGVGAALVLVSAMLPRLRRAETWRETATVEWSGYAAGLIALALAWDSLRHIAALLAAWGAVLGIAALRPGRQLAHWRALFWAAVGCEISAWWLMMHLAEVSLPEAYTLPFATLALLVGLIELRRRPELNSWMAYGPALVTALVPTLVIVIITDTSNLRQVLLLLGAVATLIFGSMRHQQAPVVIGAVVTAAAALHALTLVGPWLVLIPVGLTLLALGASREQRRRAQERLKVLRDMR